MLQHIAYEIKLYRRGTFSQSQVSSRWEFCLENACRGSAVDRQAQRLCSVTTWA